MREKREETRKARAAGPAGVSKSTFQLGGPGRRNSTRNKRSNTAARATRSRSNAARSQYRSRRKAAEAVRLAEEARAVEESRRLQAEARKKAAAAAAKQAAESMAAEKEAKKAANRSLNTSIPPILKPVPRVNGKGYTIGLFSSNAKLKQHTVHGILEQMVKEVQAALNTLGVGIISAIDTHQYALAESMIQKSIVPWVHIISEKVGENSKATKGERGWLLNRLKQLRTDWNLEKENNTDLTAEQIEGIDALFDKCSEIMRQTRVLLEDLNLRIKTKVGMAGWANTTGDKRLQAAVLRNWANATNFRAPGGAVGTVSRDPRFPTSHQLRNMANELRSGAAGGAERP